MTGPLTSLESRPRSERARRDARLATKGGDGVEATAFETTVGTIYYVIVDFGRASEDSVELTVSGERVPIRRLRLLPGRHSLVDRSSPTARAQTRVAPPNGRGSEGDFSEIV